MKKISCLLGVLLFVLIGNSACSQKKSETLDDLKAEMTKFVEKTMEKSDVVGLSLALVDNQDIIWAEGFGYSDKAKNIKATPQTIYGIASISKLFTATAIMQLQEMGKLDINSPIQTYIPEFKVKSRFENPGAITPRNILTHHSGLPNDIFYQAFTEKPDPISSIVELLNKEYTCNQPNMLHSYSNAGYGLLGALIERTSGEDFYSYTTNHLLQPMEMKSSSFRLTPEMEKFYTKGYADGKEFKEPLSLCVSAGSMRSSVLDMANFMKMTFNNGTFNGKQIIKPETLKEMQTSQNADCKLDFNFSIGLGWQLNRNTSLGYVGGLAEHGGDEYVSHGKLRTFTDHKIGIIVLVNTKSGGSATRTIAHRILREYLELKTGIKPPKDEKVKSESITMNDQQLDAIAGVYSMGTELMVFTPKKGKLETEQNSTKLIFSPNNLGSFSVTAKLMGFFPLKIKNQFFAFKNIDKVDYLLFIESAKDTSVAGIRISKQVITDLWRSRMGEYEIVNDNAPFKVISDFVLREKDGYIFMDSKIFQEDESTMIIKPISSEEAIIDGIGRNTGATVSFNGDEMYFAGLKLKKVVAANK